MVGQLVPALLGPMGVLDAQEAWGVTFELEQSICAVMVAQSYAVCNQIEAVLSVLARVEASKVLFQSEGDAYKMLRTTL